MSRALVSAAFDCQSSTPSSSALRSRLTNSRPKSTHGCWIACADGWSLSWMEAIDSDVRLSASIERPLSALRSKRPDFERGENGVMDVLSTRSPLSARISR
eukprot:2384259-Prymnesium_polylepis.2